MHPAQKIIETAEQLLIAAFPDARVFVQRTDSLNDADMELPAIIIRMGQDTPLPSMTTFTHLGSLLSLTITIVEQGPNEFELLKVLTTRRLAVHRTVMPAGAIAKHAEMPWAIEVGYLGADKPEEDNRGELYAKALQTNWQVAYQMDRFDPDVS